MQVAAHRRKRPIERICNSRGVAQVLQVASRRYLRRVPDEELPRMANHVFPIPEPADSPFWDPAYDVDPFVEQPDYDALLNVWYRGLLFEPDPEG